MYIKLISQKAFRAFSTVSTGPTVTTKKYNIYLFK